MKKPDESFFVKISAPAERALKNIGINSALNLSKFTRKEIMQLHGMGPSTLPKLDEVLRQNSLTFKPTDQ